MKDEKPTGAFNEHLGYQFKELHSFRLLSSFGILQMRSLFISYRMLVVRMEYKLVQMLEKLRCQILPMCR